MIYHIFIFVILYLVEAFVPPLDGVNDYIDVQNSLADKANVLENEFAEYYDDVMMTFLKSLTMTLDRKK